ncbi:polysaccharide pyruvyl transferase family protein [Macrococcoides caseolyticum]|uniref:polysaccharide pyruvyl transferase family protein n=1 Tax=Macrococcoides caseolyticum TaxID=69966 RepID=UPI000C34E2F4|nr:polysaccharide pyruvyl transferase family protein [Macrococcus caseolyticus]PKE50828.1 polysaccharide pyruvyl transferase family protein [Macrococcus caseolyticus]
MKIFFKGYYGFNNLGDDIFVHAALWYCKNFLPGSKPLFVGKNLPTKLYGTQSKTQLSKNIYELYYSFKCDHVIYWGGSLFEKTSGPTDLKNWIKYCYFFRKKFSGFGVSIGPFDKFKDKKNITELVDKSNFFGVRDYKSLSYSRKASFSFDLAILTPFIFDNLKIKKNSIALEKWVIGVNFCKAENIDSYYNYVNDFCIKNKNNISKVKIFIFNKHEKVDFDYAYKIFDSLKKSDIEVDIVEYSDNTAQYIEKINEVNFMFATRLHAAIISYSLNIEFMLNEYHDKCTEFINTIQNPYKYSDNIKNHIMTIDEIKKIKNTKKDPQHFYNITIKQLENLSSKLKNNEN